MGVYTKERDANAMTPTHKQRERGSNFKENGVK